MTIRGILLAPVRIAAEMVGARLMVRVQAEQIAGLREAARDHARRADSSAAELHEIMCTAAKALGCEVPQTDPQPALVLVRDLASKARAAHDTQRTLRASLALAYAERDELRDAISKALAIQAGEAGRDLADAYCARAVILRAALAESSDPGRG